ncbi:MAG: FMN-binding protein [Mycetocola sp.]
MQTRTRQNVATALAGVAVIGGLAGCSASGSTTDDTGSADTQDSSPSTSAEYTDGNYTATGDYVSPGGQESVTVTLTLTDNTVTALEVTGSGGTPNAKRFQGEFIDNIDDIAVGKNIDELNVSKVAGSSLTSDGFNAALEQIRTDAS